MMTSLGVICLGTDNEKHIFLGRFVFQIEITCKDIMFIDGMLLCNIL